MESVSFPLLGIVIPINKIAFQIGNLKIYWYAILICCAIILALILWHKKNGKYEIQYENLLDLSIFLIPISILSARIYYVIFDLDYFMSNPSQIFQVQTGGLAIYGGIIGGVITTMIFCQKKKIDLWNILDYIVPELALGQAIGRWGNFINIEAYGTTTRITMENGNRTKWNRTICPSYFFIRIYHHLFYFYFAS